MKQKYMMGEKEFVGRVMVLDVGGRLGRAEGYRYQSALYICMKLLSVKILNKTCRTECCVNLLLKTCASGNMQICLLKRK